MTLEWALRQGWECYPLCFQYGQTNYRETHAARDQLRSYFVPKYGRQVRSLRFCDVHMGSLSDSVMLGGKGDFAHGPDISIPNRNTVFLALATTYAVTKKALLICIGVQNERTGAPLPGSGSHPDTTYAFIEDMQTVAQCYSTPEKQEILIKAPLIDLCKKDILALAKEWSVPVEKTWTCLQGKSEPCGICPPCVVLIG